MSVSTTFGKGAKNDYFYGLLQSCPQLDDVHTLVLLRFSLPLDLIDLKFILRYTILLDLALPCNLVGCKYDDLFNIRLQKRFLNNACLPKRKIICRRRMMTMATRKNLRAGCIPLRSQPTWSRGMDWLISSYCKS